MDSTKRVTLYIDPPSHHFLQDQLFNPEFASKNGDQILAPYVQLRDFFGARGISVRTADYLPDQAGEDHYVYVSMGIQKNYRKLARRSDITLSAFFAMECPIVEPSIYRDLSKAQHYFKRIFSWSDGDSLAPFLNGPLRCESFRWPQSFNTVHEEIWKQSNRKFLVMINANKLPRVYWNELYTERLRAIEFFSHTGEIDLYGVGWNRPSIRVGKTWVPHTLRRLQHVLEKKMERFRPDPLLVAARRAYKGPAISKAQTLGEYTFALCFENAVIKGWITEKVFDCFFAGTVPIYWGAPDITNYVPENCFIDMRRFANYEELRTFLRSLEPKDILQFKENAKTFLASDRYSPFRKESFVEIFRKIIEEDTGIQIA